MNFPKSPYSQKVWDYFERRYSPIVAPIGLLKVLTIHGAGVNGISNGMGHVDNSRNFKTKTTNDATRFFEEEKDYIKIEGEKTIHGIYEEYGSKGFADLDKKCLIYDDGAVLFNAMYGRSKYRFFGAMNDLLSNHRYDYTAKKGRFIMTGRISCIMNIPTPTWNIHKTIINELSTCGAKMLFFHTDLNREAHSTTAFNFRKTGADAPKIPIPFKITKKDRKIILNEEQFRKENVGLFNEGSILSLRKVDEIEDSFFACARENARLNHRNYICKDDVKLLQIVKEYMVDPKAFKEYLIVWALDKNYSSNEIIAFLKVRNFSVTKGWISRIRKKYTENGLLDHEMRINPKRWEELEKAKC